MMLKLGGNLQSDDFSDRLLDFAIRAIRLCESLPNTYLGNHVKKQLIRSSTAVGANYEESRGAESDADFLHKMNVTLKEARESLYWIKVINKSALVSSQRLEELVSENNEICAILTASVKTLKRNK